MNKELREHVIYVCSYAWRNRQKLAEDIQQLIKWIIENVKIDCKALEIKIDCSETYLRQQVLNELYNASCKED